MPLDPEMLARLLREDIIEVSVTMPWSSTEERERYLNAASNFHKRLEGEHPIARLASLSGSRSSGTRMEIEDDD
jgi:hypothetical protein